MVKQGKCRYKYPLDYFDLTTGYVPKNLECLKVRWEYRKKRQDEGTTLMDMDSFDSLTLIDEMNALRNSLLKFAQLKYMDHIRPLLNEHGFVRPSDSQSCVTMNDVLVMIKECPNLNLGKSDILFEIFYHKGIEWSNKTVDNWALCNDIEIMPGKTVASMMRKPNASFFRGSFCTIVNSARMETLKRIMRNMWSGQGWKITIARNKAATNTAKYTPKVWSKDITQRYFIVEDIPSDDTVNEVNFFVELFIFVLQLILNTFIIFFTSSPLSQVLSHIHSVHMDSPE